VCLEPQTNNPIYNSTCTGDVVQCCIADGGGQQDCLANPVSTPCNQLGDEGRDSPPYGCTSTSGDLVPCGVTINLSDCNAEYPTYGGSSPMDPWWTSWQDAVKGQLNKTWAMVDMCKKTADTYDTYFGIPFSWTSPAVNGTPSQQYNCTMDLVIQVNLATKYAYFTATFTNGGGGTVSRQTNTSPTQTQSSRCPNLADGIGNTLYECGLFAKNMTDSTGTLTAVYLG
jgi:hypothetical protein